jgi:hypothetical protein
MPRWTYFQQKRHDGGTRAGLESDDEAGTLSDFQEGPPDLAEDPLGSALLWYLDVRCAGEDLPRDVEQARHWFREHVPILRPGRLAMADMLRAGVDDSYPVRWGQFENRPPGVAIEAVFSCTRGLSGQEQTTIIGKVAKELESDLERLTREEIARH